MTVITKAASAEKVDRLLEQATASLKKGRLEDHADGKQGSISLLRATLRLDEDNVDATVLLGKVIEKKYQRTEQHINQRNFDAAAATLDESDKLIREFMLTEKLQRQVTLESKITILRQEQKQIDQLLANAKKAIQRGDISKDDASSANALAFLSRVMFKQPGNKNGKKLIDDIVALRQQAAQQALDNNEMEQAGTYLGETERLIRKYKLKQRRTVQQTLDFVYQAALTRPQSQDVTVELINKNVEIITLTPEPGSTPQNNSISGAAHTAPTPQTHLRSNTDNGLPVERLDPNSLGIQTSRIEDINTGSELLQPEQVFIPETTPGTIKAQTTPIWETENLQQIPQNSPPVVIYDPNAITLQPAATPQNNNAVLPAPTQPVVSYTPSRQNSPSPAVNQPQAISVLPDELPLLIPHDQLQQLPIVAEFLPPVTVADQQAMTNVQIPLGEMVPELIEIPISAIEEILPAQ